MATYQAEGVILRRSNLGEADRVLTIFAKDYGKLRVVARAARRPTAKLSGSLETFYQANFRFAKGRNLDIVVEAAVIKNFSRLRRDIKAFHLANFAGEIVDKTTRDGQANNTLYGVLLEGLGALHDLDKISEIVFTDAIILKSLSSLGYLPELKNCAIDREPLSPGGNFWSPRTGGVVCADHASQTDSASAIDDNAIKFLRLILVKRIGTLAALSVDQNVLRQSHRFIEDFFNYHFDITLRSKKYVDLAGN